MAAQTPKPKFDFDNAGNIKLKIRQLEEGVERADKNVEIFSQEVEHQKALKKQLQEDLSLLKLQAKQQGVKLEESN